MYLANRVLAVVCEGEELDRASVLVPFLRGKRADNDNAAAYLCRNKSCQVSRSIRLHFAGTE
jgi:uncharacterized protein